MIPNMLSQLRTAVTRLTQCRTYLTHYPPINSGEVRLERRPKKRIQVGKARPAIYYKFDQLVQLSDGSVVKRRLQTPKLELRFINDMRNHPLWNESKKNLTQINEKAAGRLNKFKQKYEVFETVDSSAEESKTPASTSKAKPDAKAESQEMLEEDEDEAFELDDYLALMGENVQEVASGGKLASHKRAKAKGKK